MSLKIANIFLCSISAVIDPRTGDEISIQEAVEAGIVNYAKGMYCNPTTREAVSIPEAMSDGRIKVEMPTFTCSYHVIQNKYFAICQKILFNIYH